MTDNPLAGLPLHYLIGADDPGPGHEGVVTEVGYDVERPVAHGLSIAYCNLFDEKNCGRFKPYLASDAVARKYREGQIDPKGAGWGKNLHGQFSRRKKQGFKYVELDNPDAYDFRDVMGAVELAAAYGFKVVAKNPLLLELNSFRFLMHPDICGAIVEEGAGSPHVMDELRKNAKRPDLSIWFVAFGEGHEWARQTARLAVPFKNMHVTYASKGEYGNAIPV